jgi:hypothetical protein
VKFTYFDSGEDAKTFAEMVRVKYQGMTPMLVCLVPYYLSWNNKWWVAIPVEIDNYPSIVLDTDQPPISDNGDN